jgi:hypothetical protein
MRHTEYYSALVKQCSQKSGGISFVRLAVDGLALNKLWDLPQPPKSLVESKKNDSCGTRRDQNLLLSFIIKVFS